MFRAAIATAVTLFLATFPAAGQSVFSPATPAVVDQTTAFIDAFGVAMDVDADSEISAKEMDVAGHDIFRSMDVDGNGFLTPDEMIGWEHGFIDLATFRGREAEFATAVQVIFELMDTNRDQRLDAREHATGLQLARRLADRDGDGGLSLTEFREDFIVITAVRRGVGSETPR